MFVIIAAISISGCSDPAEVALTTYEGHKGQAAVEKLTDQSVLTNVAMEANSWITRRDAVRRLTDQATLTKIALDTIQDFNVREVAVGKLTDQSTITEIALNKADNFNVRIAAVRKLTDQSTITEIALDNAAPFSVREDRVREAAVYSLTDQAMLTKVAFKTRYYKSILKKFTVPANLESLSNINNNRRVQLIYKYIRAFDGVPEEHRLRLINSIFPAILNLDKTEYRNKFGEIVSVEIAWSSKNRQYSEPFATTSMTKPGELVECSIKLMNLSEPVSHRWLTNFPRDLMTTREKLTFSAAEIKAWDLYGPVKKLLSQ